MFTALLTGVRPWLMRCISLLWKIARVLFFWVLQKDSWGNTHKSSLILYLSYQTMTNFSTGDVIVNASIWLAVHEWQVNAKNWRVLIYYVVNILSMANILRNYLDTSCTLRPQTPLFSSFLWFLTFFFPAALYLFSATPLGSRKLSTYDGWG